LVEFGTGRVLVNDLEIADRYWPRLVGYQLRSRPAAGSGLLLAPCASIHTLFVRFSIDAAMLDRSGRVVELRRGIKPWRAVVPSKPTYATLEVPSGAGGLNLEVGTIVRLQWPGPDAQPPRVLRALRSWVDGR
jgi:uncharacterized membrane protein (UPF0127 family)